MLRVVIVLALVSLVATSVAAQAPAMGDEVILQSENPRGVPLHRTSSASLMGYAQSGSSAVVVDTAHEGRWLRVSMGDASGWVLGRYASIAIDAPAAVPIAGNRLLEAACTGTGDRQYLPHDLFNVCFDRSWRIPVWVSYALRHDAMSGPGDRDESSWGQDDRLEPQNHQARDIDYDHSGYNRGHLAPAEAFTRTQTAVDFTHRFTNAVPQFGNVNSGAWSRLEAGVRNRVEDGEQAWVVTGSLPLETPSHCFQAPVSASCFCLPEDPRLITPNRRMRNEIVIPSHTFKAIITFDGTNWHGFGFILANVPRGAGNYLQYQYPIDLIEELLGIDLFSALPDMVEAQVEISAEPLAPITSRRVHPCLTRN